MNKYFKQFLLLVLIFAISMNTCFVAYSYGDNVNLQSSVEEVDVVIGECFNARDFLNRIGILPENFLYAGDSYITKVDFLILTLRMLGIDDSLLKKPDRQIFWDISIESEYAPYVQTAYEMQIITGDEDGTFSPESKLDVSTAYAIITRALGGEIFAKDNGGYPAGYLTFAHRFLDEIKVAFNNNHSITFDESLLIIYNALNAEYRMKLDGSFVASTGETLLNSEYKINTIYGVVEANSVVSIYGESVLSAGWIMIDGHKFKTDEIFEHNFIGHKVKAFYRKNDEQNMVVYMHKFGAKEITLDLQDVCSYKPTELTYLNDLGKSKVVKVASNAKTICNNEKITITDEYIIPTNGEISLIDNDSDGKYDVVIIFNYELAVVNMVDQNNSSIYSFNNFKSINEIKDYDNIIIEDIYGEPKTLSDIKKYDVLEIYESKNKNFIKIIINTSVINFTVKSIQTESRQSGNYDVLEDENGNVYETIPNFSSYNNGKILKPGVSYQFVTDKHNRIIMVVAETQEYYLGYVTGAMKDGVFDSYIKIKVFSEKNQFEILETDSKVKLVNNDSLISLDDLLYILNTNQIIRYKINSKGKVSAIEIAGDENATTGFRKTGTLPIGVDSDTIRYFSNIGIIGGKLAVKPNAMVFLIPEDERDSEAFVAKDNLLSDGAMYSGATGYTFGEKNSLMTDVLVMTESYTTITRRTGLEMLVTGISQVYDEKNGVMNAITGFVNGVERQFLADDGIEFKDVDETNNYIYVSEGDSIRLALGREGYVQSVEIMYDADEHKRYGVVNANDTGITFGAEKRTVFGTPYIIEDNYFKIVNEPDGEIHPEIFSIGPSTYVYVYDSSMRSSAKCKVGNINDMITMQADPLTSDKVFMFTQYQTIKYMVIYK